MSSSGISGTRIGVRGWKFGLILIVAAVIAGLAALDWSLAQAEQAEMRSSAERAYRDGMGLLKRGDANAAVDALRRAQALERNDEEYELALIEALVAAGKVDEAQPLMNQVLEDDPNAGPANLVAARLMVKRGRLRDAEAYYHRAIYGDWPTDSSTHRVAARMELIQLLKANHIQQELLAELLPLEEEAGKNQPLQAQLAQLFLAAGASAHAADLYRAMLQHDPNNVAAYEGLGEADLERGEYRAAHGNLLQAFYHNPQDARIRERLDLANLLGTLDPTARQLSPDEKYRRSVHLLELVRANVKQCLSKQRGPAKEEVQRLLVSADPAVSDKANVHPTNEMAENTLALAQKIWRARPQTCAEENSSDDEAVRLLMEKLAQ